MTLGRRLVPVAVLALLAGGLGACGDGERSGGGAGAPASRWPSGGAAVDASGLVWAAGDTVHLADGSTITVGEEIDTFVVGGPGVFFTTKVDDAGPAYGGELFSRPLRYAEAAGGSGRSRVVARAAASPRTSPDGRYLAFLDLASGRKDDFGTRQIETVVVDLSSGEEVARTAAGMGDPGSDDLEDLYSESSLAVLAVRDGTAYVDTTDPKVLAIDLESGEATTTDRAADDFDLPPAGTRTSPDGRWRIVDVERDRVPRDRIAGSAGRDVPLRGVPSTLDLLWWVDDTTAAGYAVDGGVGPSGFAPGASASLVTCEVPSGRCRAVPGTSGVVSHVPEGTVDGTTFDLPGGNG